MSFPTESVTPSNTSASIRAKAVADAEEVAEMSAPECVEGFEWNPGIRVRSVLSGAPLQRGSRESPGVRTRE